MTAQGVLTITKRVAPGLQAHSARKREGMYVDT